MEKYLLHVWLTFVFSGRVHPANVKAVDQAKCTVMVEWFEKSVCRGKEVRRRMATTLMFKLNSYYLDLA